jgi:glycosyltransferase involved in cell wall biosynthesis
MERILVVANDFPYPPNNGASLDTWGRIQALKKMGFMVDLVATVFTAPSQEDIQIAKRDVDNVLIVNRERDWKAALSWQPYQLKSRAALQTADLSGEYAAAVLEAEKVSPILRNPRLRARKLILRVQNDEARFAREAGRSCKSLIEKVFYELEAARFMIVSPSVQAKCDALWFISDFEMQEHLKKHPAHATKSFFLPPTVEANSMRRQSLEGRRVLFIGTLSLPSNLRAMEWYISNVHPRLCNTLDYRFVVAGNTRGTPPSALRDFIRLYPNIDLYEDPKDIYDLYKDAAVFVNPVLRGAGLKMKTIDAIQAGVPVVSTSTGIEGSRLGPGTHVLVGDSPLCFADCVSRLLTDKNLGQKLVAAAQDFLIKEYDPGRIIRQSLSKIAVV